MKPDHDTLRILEDALGIESHYSDTESCIHYASKQVIADILATKGICVREDLLEHGPAVVVASAQAPPEEIALALQTTRSGEDGEICLDGSLTLTESSGLADPREHPLVCGETCSNTLRTQGAFIARVPYPKGLREGIYRFQVNAGTGSQRARGDIHCIVCPDKCYEPTEMQRGQRLAGVSVAVYGLRSTTNWGIGDFSDLRRVIDWAAEQLGVDFVGINPLHDLFNKRPFNSSPYLPSSRLYKNFVYLDIPGMPDFKESQEAKMAVELPERRMLLESLRNQDHVDYEEVARFKLDVLKKVFQAFLAKNGPKRGGTERWCQFEAYGISQGEALRRFALFCSLRDFLTENMPSARTWREWPVGFRRPEEKAVVEFEQSHTEEVLFWMYVQWQIHLQLQGVQDYAVSKGMLLGLYHDLALAVDRNGADCWAWPDFFHDGFRVGAPPDAFAPRGQDWGFPPPNRERLRASGFDLFLKNLDANSRYGGALRIDHVMQFNHLFWIPQGKTPSEGVYVKDYEEELLRLTALKSVQNRCVIVGEDLGTLPPGLRERLMAKGIFSYRLFYFEQDQRGKQLSFREYPSTALVSISTHDLPTLAGFWSGRDIDVRKEIDLLDEAQAFGMMRTRTAVKANIIERLFQDGFLNDQTAHPAWESRDPTDALHSAVLGFVLQTPSKLALISQEDLFLDQRQQNFPGTTSEHPNWVTKMRYSVEDLRSDAEACRMSEKMRKLVSQSGRGTNKRG